MNIPYTDTIFLGIIRMLLWILFLYVLKRLFFKGKPSQNQVKTMGNLWAFYGSIVLVVIYLLVQFNSYDLLTVMALMFVFLVMRLVGFENLRFKGESWVRKRRTILLNVIENVEDKDPIIDVRKSEASKRFSVKTGFYVATAASIVAVAARFYLMQYDNYQLSTAWFQELNILKALEDQEWFGSNLVLTGQYAFMSFYGLITGISTEMALESFALFQVFILCFVIFWFIDAMTNSLVTIPLLGTLAFALFFNLAPTNMAQITHSKSTFMAMSFLLPAIIFIRKPWKLYKERPNGYFFGMVCIFAAIALIDLYTLLILLPPFFLVSLPFTRKRYIKYYFKALGAYVLSSSLVLLSYAYSAYEKDIDYGLFIRSNLLSVSASTTTVNMALDYDSTVFAFQVLSLVAVIVMFFLYRNNSRKWVSPMVFIIYVNALVLWGKTGFIYFDNDLLNEISPILLACSLSFVFYIAYYFLNSKVIRVEISDAVSAPLIFILFFALAYFTQQPLLQRTQKRGTLSKNILEAYEKVKDSYIPYGYAVVNANNLIPMSRGSHHFISYDDFVENYPERDSVYFQYKEDKDFLVRNTEYILPNSLLIFIYENVSSEFAAKVRVSKETNKNVLIEIDRLRKKGREVRLFYKKDNLRVYEIVNNPGEAKIDELL